MSSIDLNIIQRGTGADFNWSAEYGYITAADMVKISEQRTDKGGSLNALPTPFARFFIFKEAFRRVLEHKNNPKTTAAGIAYERLVSNCLDVYELLYNLQFHQNHWKDQNRRIVIKEWKLEEDLTSLKNNVPVLGNAVECYYKDDLGLDTNVLYFIVLEDKDREYLLGTSSPYTGFITPPDLDRIEVNVEGKIEESYVGENYANLNYSPLKRKTSGKYFHDILLFEGRDKDFKNFMYNKMFGNGNGIDSRYTEIRNYIQSFKSDKDIKSDWSHSSLKPVISEENNNVTINGLPIYYNTDEDTVNYFSEILIRVPYRISSENYETLSYINDSDNRNYDYLLPITKEGILALNTTSINCVCKESKNNVEIILKHKNKEYSKKYSFELFSTHGTGKIIPMDQAKINFDMGIFPNILSSIPGENNYFKLIVCTQDVNDVRKTFTKDSLDFSFYNMVDEKLQLIETALDADYENGVRPCVIRSKQGVDNSESNTLFYEIFNTEFRVISSTISFDKYSCEFVIIPKWREAKASDKSFVYAIDLGTSNTYISRRERGEMKQPQQLKMDKEIVSYFHQRKLTNGKSRIFSWEENMPKDFQKHFKTEFLPTYIDGSLYKFPLRTALCMTGEDVNSPILFDNCNIAFLYEKYRGLDNQRYITNIKWSEDDRYLEVFIRELLLIIKTDILQENGNLSNTEIIWFRPLSFKNKVRELFANLWKKLSKEILNLQDVKTQIKCYTESEAPYYYFDNEGIFKSVESVAVMDIGGGSTDFVYYSNGIPQMANSVHFGCDIIWGNAYNKYENAKGNENVNGIYSHYKDSIRFENKDLGKLYDDMNKSEHTTTRDIINFWINNNSDCGIINKMKTDHPAVFAYHYTALIYYMASMFKTKELNYPRTITFSGNGSKYIDNFITSDKDILTELTSLIISKVYGKDKIGDIQLILPDYRKECTCYGGLYHQNNTETPKQVLYMGDGTKNEYENVKDLKEAFNGCLRENIESEIDKLHQIYEIVLRYLIKQEEISIPVERMMKVVTSEVKDSLKTRFQTEIVNKYTNDEGFNDTLFFLPVVQSLFNLTKEYK